MNDLEAPRPLAVVTGASTGIGYHLARCAAEHGYDLVVAADTPLTQAVRELKKLGAAVDAVQCDLATTPGVQKLLDVIGQREVDALLANAGHGLGGRFLDQEWEDILHVVNTNVTGTLHLVYEVGNRMRQRVGGPRTSGRILITGSVAGFQPGALHAVYNGSKAFIDSFAMALRNELQESRITVSCLMPGPTDTEFFVRAHMDDTRIANDPKMMMQPEEVARIGFDAMLKGEADVVTGWRNRVMVAVSKVMPGQAVAAAHAKLVEPGSAKDTRLQEEHK